MDKVNLNKYVKLNAEVIDSAGGDNSIAYKIRLKDKTNEWMSSDLNKGIAKGLSYLDSICSDQDFIAIHYDFDIPITAKFWRQYFQRLWHSQPRYRLQYWRWHQRQTHASQLCCLLPIKAQSLSRSQPPHEKI